MNVGSSKGSQSRSLNEAASWLLLSEEAECVCGCGLLKETEELLPDFSGEKNTPALPLRSDSDSFNPPTLVFSLCRNPYGQSVGNHGAGMDNVPREWGEHVCVCVPPPHSCSICLLIKPGLPATAHLPLFYIFVFAVFVCVLGCLKRREANGKHTSAGQNRGGGA